MSSPISQILSNFKLFSQNTEPILSKTPQNAIESTMKYKLTLGFLVVVILLLVYFRRDALSKTFAGYLNASWLNDILASLWLSTHLTSAGEIASTYIPEDFSSMLGASTPLVSE
jgi:hypothetical protein